MNSGKGSIKFSDGGFNAVRVFSATMMKDRAMLGDNITNWITDNPQASVVEIVVTQSSDEAFHCLTFTVFYNE